MLVVSEKIRIPLREFRFQFSKSSGPGGQHVNKTSSKATLRWNVAASPSISEAVRSRFLARYGKRITASGELVLSSQRFRDQGRNVADCIERLRQLLADVAAAPKRRKKTAPGRAAKEKRLREKKRKGEAKRTRARVRDDD